MRQTHAGGDKVFIDFAGDTIDIFDPITGSARHEAVRRGYGCLELHLRRGLSKLSKREPVQLEKARRQESYRQILVTAEPVRRRRLWADGQPVWR